MIRCTEKGCRKAVSRGKTAGTPHEQAWWWTWKTGWRCPAHAETVQVDEEAG